MYLKNTFKALLITTLSTTALLSFAEAPTAGNALISEFKLRAADKPISKNSSWKPKRIVVNLPGYFAAQMPNFEHRLKQVAGDAEIIIDESDNFVLGKDVLAGADAIIGVCTPPTMKNADAKLLWLHSYFVGMDHCRGLSDEQLEKIVFTNTKRLSGPAIAEHSIAMLMALTKGLPTYLRA